VKKLSKDHVIVLFFFFFFFFHHEKKTSTRMPRFSDREPVVKARNELHTSIMRVLKQVHPDTSMLRIASQILCDQLRELFLRLIDQCQLLTSCVDQKRTISSRTVQTSVRLVLNGELTKHAISEGVKAVTKFTSFASKASQKQRVSLQSRAGLQFPVTRVAEMMRALLGPHVRVARTASVYMTAVLEYITAEVLELAGNAARDNRRRRIVPRHLFLAVSNDQELSRLFRGHVTRGGVMPNIHEFMLPRKRPDDEIPAKGKKKFHNPW
jgi:histone H2A